MHSTPRLNSILRGLVLLSLATTRSFAASPDERLYQVAVALAARPNVAEYHLEVGRAYFERGMQGDAERVRAHLARAKELDPGSSNTITTMLRRTAAGFNPLPRSNEQRELDDRLKGFLPKPAPVSQTDARIHSGLAMRMARQNFKIPAKEFEENLQAVRTLFGVDGRKSELKERLTLIDEQGHSRTPWQRAYRQALRDAAQQTNSLRLRRQEGSGNEIPDPIVLKNVAYLQYLAGKMAGCHRKLLAAVAAADTHHAASIAQLTRSPRARPEPSLGLTRRVATAALETLEAIDNEEIPPQIVGNKLTALCAMGTIGDPLLLDLNGNGHPDVSGALLPDGRLEEKDARSFDLDGDGQLERVEWVTGGDGLLVVDLNGNGRIDSGRELFGTAFGDDDGFGRLARYDIDGDGFVAGIEAANLALWLDDGDAICQTRELKRLDDFGIKALPYVTKTGQVTLQGNAEPLSCWEWCPDLHLQ